ncbi:MAG: hypothetical protein N3I86_09365 [Verrucomicrobiae bacterium]|nr:hypothetical protein [Verrucomicrobiae bacterium]
MNNAAFSVTPVENAQSGAGKTGGCHVAVEFAKKHVRPAADLDGSSVLRAAPRPPQAGPAFRPLFAGFKVQHRKGNRHAMALPATNGTEVQRGLIE